MRVEIWSDVVCPWCYIGKRRFETALADVAASRDTSTIDVVYRPFQLDPTAAPGRAQPVIDAYAKKFGGEERATQIIDHVTKIAAADGIEFHLERGQRANTLLAHRLLGYAESHAPRNQAALKERLMHAYFSDGDNVGDPEVLVRCAADVGFDPDEARTFLASDDGRGEVMEQLALAASQGITAVPTYVFNGQFAVPGAQDVALFERIINRMLDLEQEGQASATPEHDEPPHGETCDV